LRRSVKPTLHMPPDLAHFWAETSQLLDDVDPDVDARDLPGVRDSPATLQRLAFSSLGGVRVGGYLLSQPGPRPLVVHSHGYGESCEERWDWAAQGLNVLGVDIRGCGTSAGAAGQVSSEGYVLTGITSPETSILRGAVCDYARALQVARQLAGPHLTRLVGHGISFAGGLAIMAEAMIQVVDLLVVGVPTFGWGAGRQFFVKQGSGAELSNYLARRPQSAEDLALVLRYFDTMNMAPGITCPTLVGLGLSDDVVPAETVYAIANHLSGPHEVMEFPVSHSDHPDEQLWEQFDARCVALALEGPSPTFGQ
jgi:cephalosporin-C deacetylase